MFLVSKIDIEVCRRCEYYREKSFIIMNFMVSKGC